MNTVQFKTKQFESLSPYLARFGNFFYGFDGLGKFDFCGNQAEIKPLFGKKYSSCVFVLTVKVGNTEFKIAFEKDDFLLWHSAIKNEGETAEDLSAVYSDVFPLALKQALLESLLLPYLQKFCAKTGEQVQLLDINYEEDFQENKPYLAFSWEIAASENAVAENAVAENAASWSCLCFVAVPEDMQALALLDKIAAVLPVPEKQAETASDIPVHIHFSLAETVLPVADMQALCKGDIVFFDEYHAQKSAVRIYPHVRRIDAGGKVKFSEHAYFVAELKDNNAVVLEWVQAVETHPDREEEKMAEHTENTIQNPENESGEIIRDENSQAFDISDLAVNVHFLLDERVISLQELQNIKPGYVFALDKDFLSPVTLAVQGKSVGKGKIVDINGTVGVQITELYK